MLCLLCVLLFSDGIDGKQARRTKTSSPLGELFDHGLDSWAALFIPVAVYGIFGRGEHGVSAYNVYLLVVGIMVCFVASHWEKYNTGVLFLPWGYDIGQIVSFKYFIWLIPPIRVNHYAIFLNII